MQIKPEHLEQLELEVQHIFDSGANEVRVYNMIQAFIEKRGKTLFIPIVVDSEVELCGKSNCNRQKLDGNVYCSYHYDINFG